MGGSTSKPKSPPPRKPSPPPPSQSYVYSNSSSGYSFNYVSSPSSTGTQAKSTSSSYQSSTPSQTATNANSNVTNVPAIPATVSVTHPADSYRIPNTVISNESRPEFADVCLGRSRFIKIERYVMTLCPQYLSKKGCCIQYCYRFHVCQFWVKGACNRDSCQYDHGFHDQFNRHLFDILKSRRFDELQMMNVLKRNMFRSKELVRENDLPICVEFILNRCKKDDCKYYHFKNPFVWQIRINNNWVGFPQELNVDVENLFTVPSNTKCSVSFKRARAKTPKVNPIFLSNTLEVDFDNMTLSSKGLNYKIRRLSTESDVKKFIGLATRWLWYWQDDLGCWNFYKNAKLRDTDMVVIPFSDYLETEYLKNTNVVFIKFFDENSFEYDINLQTMVQTNQRTSKGRRIRRRPMPNNEKSSWNENTSIRNLWSITEDSSEKFIRTAVVPQSTEYLYFKQMMMKTVHVQNFSLERIENINLWKAYQIKKSQMLANYDNDINALSEQYLFHGTSKSVVEKICAHNLDWRLYGTRVGNIYGKGTYFSSSAALSDNYATNDEDGFKWMFIILVLVGKACVGNGGIVIPPLNPSTKMRFDSTVESATNPTIFVKYNLDDYYPAYIVKYSSSSW